MVALIDNDVVVDEFTLVRYDEEDYRQLRKKYSQTHDRTSEEPQAPAWARHKSSMPVKPERFRKLNQWDSCATKIQGVLMWTLVVVGFGIVATPAVIRLVH